MSPSGVAAVLVVASLASFTGACGGTTVPRQAQVQPEDCGTLTFGVDGSPTPTTCADGHPNVHAVDMFRSDGRLTIDLDPAATPQQVTAALCIDFVDTGITQALYDTARALNRWTLVLDPVAAVTSGSLNCPALPKR